MAAKGELTSDNVFLFHCPACGISHGPRVSGDHPVWTWNGSMDAPTFSPSLSVKWGPDGKRHCHSFVRDGKIEYCNDSTHAMAGQTVNLPDWESV